MSKIRINELARQLEVKSREVIDKLHELGIAEKVTHSSSIDEDKADQLRRYYSGESHAPLPAATQPKRRRRGRRGSSEAEEDRAPRRPVRNDGLALTPGAADPEASATPEVAEPKTEPRAGSAPARPRRRPKPKRREDDNKPRAIPLRPPVLGRGISDSSAGRCAASACCTPRPRFDTVRPPRRDVLFHRRRGRFRLPARLGPDRCFPVRAQPMPASLAPGSGLPAPAPQRRLPASALRLTSPVAPRPAAPQARPGVPDRSSAASRRFQGGAPVSRVPPPVRRAAATGQRPLAGQPAARPIVPPRPDLVAKLGQQQPRSPMPGQAPPPRPGVPLRPQTPRPGQPLYQGPPRPGAAPMAGPQYRWASRRCPGSAPVVRGRCIPLRAGG